MSIQLPEHIDDFQLMSLIYCSANDCLTFELIDPIKPEQFYVIEMKELIHFSMSKDLEKDEDCFPLGHFEHNKLNEKTSLFEKLTAGSIHSKFYHGQTFHHLKIEGFICLEALGTNFSLKLIRK